MYLLYNLARYSVQVNDVAKQLEIGRSKSVVQFPEAAAMAAEAASSDSENYRRGTSFTPQGTRVGTVASDPDIYK
jgi:hypothetical protein